MPKKTKNIASALLNRQITGDIREVEEMGRVLEGTYEEEVVGLPPIEQNTAEQLAQEQQEQLAAARRQARAIFIADDDSGASRTRRRLDFD